MIKLFKKTNIIFITVFTTLTAAYMALVVFCANDLTINIFSLFYFLCAIILLFICHSIALYEHNKLIEICNVECDAVRFINEYYPLLQIRTGKKISAMLKINLAVGYTKVGNFAQTKNVLQSININKISAPNIRTMYYMAWADVLIAENDIENTKSALVFMKEITDNEVKYVRTKEMLIRTYNVNIAYINLKCGQYAGVEEILNEAYLKSEFMVSKVDIKYILAMLYLAQGRIDDAKYALRFVAENGSTMAFAADARKRLAEL